MFFIIVFRLSLHDVGALAFAWLDVSFEQVQDPDSARDYASNQVVDCDEDTKYDQVLNEDGHCGSSA